MKLQKYSQKQNGSNVSAVAITMLVWLWCTASAANNNNVGVLAFQNALMRRLKTDYPGFVPQGVIDIGANKGDWSRPMRNLFPDTKLLLLEASPRHDAKLKEVVSELGNAEYKIAVLSDEDNEKVSFFQGGNTGNSMFLENSKHYTNDKAVERTTSRLDTIVANSLLKQDKDIVIDIIKADVQGVELVVLQGATKTLAEATFVQFEASTIEYNVWGSCLYQVDAFSRSHGFFIYNMGDLTYNPALKTKGVGQYDVLYIKPTSPRLPDFLKEQKPKFCGEGRDPLDLPGVLPSQQVQKSLLRSLESTTADGSTTVTKSCDIQTTWVSGFMAGVVLCAVMYWSTRHKRNGSKVN
jgi:FkbM family methyltransferase